VCVSSCVFAVALPRSGAGTGEEASTSSPATSDSSTPSQSSSWVLSTTAHLCSRTQAAGAAWQSLQRRRVVGCHQSGLSWPLRRSEGVISRQVIKCILEDAEAGINAPAEYSRCQRSHRQALARATAQFGGHTPSNMRPGAALLDGLARKGRSVSGPPLVANSGRMLRRRAAKDRRIVLQIDAAYRPADAHGTTRAPAPPVSTQAEPTQGSVPSPVVPWGPVGGPGRWAAAAAKSIDSPPTPPRGAQGRSRAAGAARQLRP
jgi:hypothetical protein